MSTKEVADLFIRGGDSCSAPHDRARVPAPVSALSSGGNI